MVYKSNPHFFVQNLNPNNSIKLRMHNNRHSMQIPYKFQINRFINNRAVDDPNTRAVDDQGTRAVDIPSIRAVDDPITRAVDDPSTGQRRAAIAALRASIIKKFGEKVCVLPYN